MTQRLLLISLLVLFGCGQEETKHRLAALTNQVDALQKEKDDLQKKLESQSSELEGLRKTNPAETSANSTPAPEATANPTPAPEVLETQKKAMADLQAQLDAAKPAVERLAFFTKQMEGKTATIKTSLGEIKVAFFPDVAPIHCFNFITRAECGFYNKTQFHRVIPGFMIQGGDPNSRDTNFADDGGGGTAVAIPHEFNAKKHVRGILSMARRGDPAFGAGSQFFIMHADSPQLDNQYTVFGEVTSGMDVVDKIVSVNCGPNDHPIEPVWIESVAIN